MDSDRWSTAQPLVLSADLVSFLLDSGAVINDPGGVHCGGVSPLIDAATNGHMDVVRLLVERGANLLHKDTQVSQVWADLYHMH